nr:hypothetical protein [Mycobacterium intracellulare]UQB93085.1 hypothetical protein KN252_03575 [Mycobacterium intracellulare]
MGLGIFLSRVDVALRTPQGNGKFDPLPFIRVTTDTSWAAAGTIVATNGAAFAHDRGRDALSTSERRAVGRGGVRAVRPRGWPHLVQLPAKRAFNTARSSATPPVLRSR